MSEASHAGFHPCFCIHLRRTTQHITELYDRMLEPFGVTLNQFSLLSRLNDLETGSTVELARAVGLEKSTLVRTLKPLVLAGQVEDKAAPGSRAHAWRLTEKGEATVQAALPAWRQAQARVKSVLCDGRHRMLRNLLCELANMDLPPEDVRRGANSAGTEPGTMFLGE